MGGSRRVSKRDRPYQQPPVSSEGKHLSESPAVSGPQVPVVDLNRVIPIHWRLGTCGQCLHYQPMTEETGLCRAMPPSVIAHESKVVNLQGEGRNNIMVVPPQLPPDNPLCGMGLLTKRGDRP